MFAIVCFWDVHLADCFDFGYFVVSLVYFGLVGSRLHFCLLVFWFWVVLVWVGLCFGVSMRLLVLFLFWVAVFVLVWII